MIRFLIFFLIITGFRVCAQNDIQLILKADFAISNNQFQKANNILDSVETKHFYSNYLLGESYFLQEKYDSAIVCYYNSNLLKEGYANLRLAESYALIGKYSIASNYLKMYLKTEDKDFSNSIVNKPAFETFKTTQEWKDINTEQYYSQIEKSIERAVYYKNKNELSLALDILDELVLENEEVCEPYYYRAKFIILLNQDYKYALKDLKRILKLKPESRKYNLLYADFNFHEQKYKKALEYYLKAQQIFQYRLNDRFLIAKTYYRMGEYEKAISNIDAFIKIDDQDIEALKLAGQIYYDNANYKQSIEFLNRAMYIDSRRLDLLVARGKSYLEDEQYQRAGWDFNTALDLDSQNGELWYLKGLAFLYRNKQEEACKYLKKARYLNYYKADEYLLKECQ